MTSKIDLRSLSVDECIAFAASLKLPAFRGKQIFSWAQKKAVGSIDEMTDISSCDRDKIKGLAYLTNPKVMADELSVNRDAAKLLLELDDGQRIELAVMLYRRNNSRERATCCVSSQTGCPLGCKFCATGLCGAGRDLTAGEIVAQVQIAERVAREQGFQGITNIVYMGMGEPLLNLENTQKSIFLLNEQNGMNIGIRKITVSTAGLAPQICQMADWQKQIGLAISLHSADQAKREELMPIAKKYSIKDLVSAARYYRQVTGQRVTFEYALFDGVNDSDEDAVKLGKLLKNEDSLVNIIPANPVLETGYLPSNEEKIKTFMDIVASFGIEIQRREKRGSDINAACGQLRRR